MKKGGTWKSEGVGSDGTAFSVSGEFLEVDPPRQLAHTWRYDWDSAGSTTTVTYLLDPIDSGPGTRLLIRHEGFSPEAAGACCDHASGWEHVLDWLAAHLAEQEAQS